MDFKDMIKEAMGEALQDTKILMILDDYADGKIATLEEAMTRYTKDIIETGEDRVRAIQHFIIDNPEEKDNAERIFVLTDIQIRLSFLTKAVSLKKVASDELARSELARLISIEANKML